MSEIRPSEPRAKAADQDKVGNEEPTPEVVRLSVNLAPDVADALKSLAKRNGVTLTEMVRRAISTENFLEGQITSGKKVLIADDDERTVREVLFR